MSQQWKDYHGQKRAGDFLITDVRFDGSTKKVIVQVVNVNSGRISELVYEA